MEMTNVEYCHYLRKEIDAILNKVHVFMPEKGQREKALVFTKLQEAKMWAGKILEELGSELPKEFQDKAE